MQISDQTVIEAIKANKWSRVAYMVVFIIALYGHYLGIIHRLDKIDLAIDAVDDKYELKTDSLQKDVDRLYGAK